mmetsp:Transcript_110426/g.319154  ORF Transcript_110426/g.319154 Transcript_110426/m.319154 type:complete len:409 (+) Transcript_110426:171-1397(+)
MAERAGEMLFLKVCQSTTACSHKLKLLFFTPYCSSSSSSISSSAVVKKVFFATTLKPQLHAAQGPAPRAPPLTHSAHSGNGAPRAQCPAPLPLLSSGSKQGNLVLDFGQTVTKSGGTSEDVGALPAAVRAEHAKHTRDNSPVSSMSKTARTMGLTAPASLLTFRRWEAAAAASKANSNKGLRVSGGWRSTTAPPTPAHAHAKLARRHTMSSASTIRSRQSSAACAVHSTTTRPPLVVVVASAAASNAGVVVVVVAAPSVVADVAVSSLAGTGSAAGSSSAPASAKVTEAGARETGVPLRAAGESGAWGDGHREDNGLMALASGASPGEAGNDGDSGMGGGSNCSAAKWQLPSTKTWRLRCRLDWDDNRADRSPSTTPTGDGEPSRQCASPSPQSARVLSIAGTTFFGD